jgi:hypothetical protein
MRARRVGMVALVVLLSSATTWTRRRRRSRRSLEEAAWPRPRQAKRCHRDSYGRWLRLDGLTLVVTGCVP